MANVFGDTDITGDLNISGEAASASLYVDGVSGFSAGSESAPSITFGDSGTGAYRSAADEFAIACNSLQRLKLSSTGGALSGLFTVSDDGSADTKLLSIVRAVNSNWAPKLAMTRARSGDASTQDGDYLGQFLFCGYNAAGSPAATPAADIYVQQIGSAGATYLGGRMIFRTGTNAATLAERMHIKSTGEIAIAGPIAVNGATPATKPTVTGSKGSNAALTSLITALANMGFITDSTS